MPMEPSSSLTSTLARLRGPAGRARRWLAARGLATRIALLVIGLGTLGLGGYYASLDDPADQAMAWLYEGRKLSGDKLAAIKDALDAAGIPYAADPSLGKIGVKPERKVEALAAVAKRGVIPHSLDDLNKEDEAAGFLDDAYTRERRELARLQQRLKLQIEQLDPTLISSADVQVHRPRSPRGGKVTTFVYLQTEGARKLRDQSVKGIETFLLGEVPDLKPDGITVADQTGREYLVADNPALKDRLQTHAREQDWQDQIHEELRHIPDVGVAVLLEQFMPPPPAPLPTKLADSDVPHPNGKVDLGPDPVPAAPGPPPAPITKARVWVRVPRSFYFLEAQAQSPGHHPSPEDLQAMVATTRQVISHAVEAHIPKDILGPLVVDTVQDDLANSRTPSVTTVPEYRQAWIWPVAGGSAAIVAALIATTLRLTTRKPPGRTSPSAWRPGFVADGPNGPVPGPSERVRELIRTSPEAAAGVLQRWIGQEGATG